MSPRIHVLFFLLPISAACGLGALAQAQAQTRTAVPSPDQMAAQDAIAQETARQPQEPKLKPNPLEALRKFEPADDEEYRLGRGDEITVDFAGRPDLAAKLIVGPDGRITLPLAGDVVLDGLTRGDAAKAIDSALSGYYANLSAQVTVTKYTANKVLVLGAVDKPGVVTFDGTPTLLEALTRSSLENGPNRAAQMPERCAIYRGRDQVVWVELKALMDSGNGLADLRLHRDDVIYVPNGAERFVSVLGQVQKPGAVPLTNASTLASVLASAGGFTPAAGNKPHIQIVDPAGGDSRIVSLNDVLNPAKSLEITLKPGEIVFVPQSGFYRATYFLERLNPAIQAATLSMVGVGIP
jgi:polysaccharide export outer membrane protein